MYSSDTFRDRVIAQIELLNNGKPLDAFDEFVADSVTVYDNGALVASNAAEARARQVKALKSATDIKGSIHDLTIADDTEICVFRDKTALGGQGQGPARRHADLAEMARRADRPAAKLRRAQDADPDRGRHPEKPRQPRTAAVTASPPRFLLAPDAAL
jgi:hypothetical protein